MKSDIFTLNCWSSSTDWSFSSQDFRMPGRASGFSCRSLVFSLLTCRQQHNCTSRRRKSDINSTISKSVCSLFLFAVPFRCTLFHFFCNPYVKNYSSWFWATLSERVIQWGCLPRIKPIMWKWACFPCWNPYLASTIAPSLKTISQTCSMNDSILGTAATTLIRPSIAPYSPPRTVSTTHVVVRKSSQSLLFS